MGDMHPNAQLVLRGFQAFAEGDMDTMRSVLHPDITWHAGGNNRWTGTYQGIDAVLDYFGRISAEADIDNQLHAALADDDHVVVLVNANLSREGNDHQAQNVFVFHVDEGRVTETWTTSLNPYADDEFWG